MDQPGFFEVGERLARLSDLGDQLEAFARAVDFERSRPRSFELLGDQTLRTPQAIGVRIELMCALQQKG